MSSLIHQPGYLVAQEVRVSIFRAMAAGAAIVVGGALLLTYGLDLRADITQLDAWSWKYWVQKLFYQGPIPYAILFSFLSALLYIALSGVST